MTQELFSNPFAEEEQEKEIVPAICEDEADTALFPEAVSCEADPEETSAETEEPEAPEEENGEEEEAEDEAPEEPEEEPQEESEEETEEETQEETEEEPSGESSEEEMQKELDEIEKAISLFQYISELNRLKQKSIVNIRDYRWSLLLENLPNDPEHIRTSFRDHVEGEPEQEEEPLLSIQKPQFTACPLPPSELMEWLEEGWEDYNKEVSRLESILRPYVVHPEFVPVSESDVDTEEETTEEETTEEETTEEETTEEETTEEETAEEETAEEETTEEETTEEETAEEETTEEETAEEETAEEETTEEETTEEETSVRTDSAPLPMAITLEDRDPSYEEVIDDQTDETEANTAEAESEEETAEESEEENSEESEEEPAEESEEDTSEEPEEDTSEESAEETEEESEEDDSEENEAEPASETDLDACYREAFEDEPSRVEAYDSWLAERNAWAAHQKVMEQTNALFIALYQQCVDLERDSETLEMVAANGFLKDKEDSDINHPVVTRRVKVVYDPLRNCLNIVDAETPAELYTVLFQEMKNINLAPLNHLQEELRNEDYHPMDRVLTPDYLKSLVHQLSARSRYLESGDPFEVTKRDRLFMLNKPCFLIRNRLDGTVKCIEQIIANIKETGYIPDPISDIISGGKIEITPDNEDPSLEEELAEVSGESSEILLAKEANREQLEIAKRIDRYNAVLAQGPPGTGKTHSITNLLGHFLAQGKSVLVTSHTTKALRVLKDKVDPEMQDLCVSLLDDTNQDMERSIDGIITHMAQTTSFEVKKEMEQLKLRREELIRRLGEIRKNIYQVLESEHTPIHVNGETISPAEAAAFVTEHGEELSYIPGYVRQSEELPVSIQDLARLYGTNDSLSSQDESELQHDLPDPATLMSVQDFHKTCEDIREAGDRIDRISTEKHLEIRWELDNTEVSIIGEFGAVALKNAADEDLKALSEIGRTTREVKNWMLDAAVDGRRGSSYLGRWKTLIEKIESTCLYAEEHLEEQFGHNIDIDDGLDPVKLEETLAAIKKHLVQSGRVPSMVNLFNRDIGQAMRYVSIDDEPIRTPGDCDLVIHYLTLNSMREECSRYWGKLFNADHEPAFFALDEDEPERVAMNRVDMVKRYINWYQDEYQTLTNLLYKIGISGDVIYGFEELDSDRTRLEKILRCTRDLLPSICQVGLDVNLLRRANAGLQEMTDRLTDPERSRSPHCRALAEAIDSYEEETYEEAFRSMDLLYEKLQVVSERSHLLSTLASFAPQWAEAIRSRSGIHGETVVPADIEEAWKWKQCESIVRELLKVPFAKYQGEAVALSTEYRKITAEYAAKSAWYHLLHETEADIDMKHALIGWKQTVKRIGKGTGKNAALYRAKARELMSKCQRAVPVWIMPLRKALESLDPKTNRFDIIIIDEASQSDISTLAILYMGKKLIIVGDDRQVSPSAIGIPIDQMNALKQMYIDGKIPNSHLYDAKTSIYDVAATTFQPLMLREHFRCMPEIIRFSNELSYDNKILPLRDAGTSVIRPVLVNYRVEGGVRTAGKTNVAEARAIVSLIQSCITMPEYEDKTFGVISMLGEEQAKLIQRMILEEMDPLDITSRKILCGNASNFQGDERDIIFLSLVDSNSGNGPMRIQNYGVDDAMRKRYNVAVSRARDQLWVVHSLDVYSDLKPGDLRRTLIEFAMNKPEEVPEALKKKSEDNEDSFENKVYRELIRRGYKVEKPWTVANYVLDMVALSGDNKVIIECDGEDLNCSCVELRKNMERQIILERIGWHFIRVRGTDFFLDREAAMQGICEKLALYHVFPEGNEETSSDSLKTEDDLLARVIAGMTAVAEQGETTGIVEVTGENAEQTETVEAVSAVPAEVPAEEPEGSPSYREELE